MPSLTWQGHPIKHHFTLGEAPNKTLKTLFTLNYLIKVLFNTRGAPDKTLFYLYHLLEALFNLRGAPNEAFFNLAGAHNQALYNLGEASNKVLFNTGEAPNKARFNLGGGTSDKALFNLGGALNFHQTVSGIAARRLCIIKVFTSIRYCLPSIPVNINRFTWCHFQR